MNTDFVLEHQGTIAILRPLTDRAKAWVEDNVSQEGYQPCWPMLIIEHRYVEAIIDGLLGDGLTMRYVG